MVIAPQPHTGVLSRPRLRPQAPGRVVGFVDLFDGDCKQGKVVGSSSADGVERLGADVERVMGIDHGALRISPLMHAGWGRAHLAYGPYKRTPGLMFAAAVLNGHNTSQWEPLPERMRTRLAQWLKGHGQRSEMPGRAWHWLRYKRKGLMLRRLRWWWRMSRRLTPIDESLGVGWWPVEAPHDPAIGANAFVMHAALGDNGELWVHSNGRLAAVQRGVQNVPIVYATVLRERGAAYYAASLDRAHGMAPYPHFRPLAIDAMDTTPIVYGGVGQATLGQIGFRVDTRVYGTQIGVAERLAEWYSTAHAADALDGAGLLASRQADAGGEWNLVAGAFERSDNGCLGRENGSLALLDASQASGLIHAMLQPAASGATGLVWRFVDRDNYCAVVLASQSLSLSVRRAGQESELALAELSANDGELHSLQLLDDGDEVTVALDGARVLNLPLDDAPAGNGVGFCGDAGACISRFEAHPRSVDFSDLVDLAIPSVAKGGPTVVEDDFDGPAGSDLDGRITGTGGHAWRKEYGLGRFLLDDTGSVRVDASRERPNPGNTAYTIEWPDSEFVDVSIEVTPPGSKRGDGESGRGGVILWQDKDNFFTISMYVDDSYDGASIAIFSHLDGFEEIYDAVWSMVGEKMHWGRPHELRVASDGESMTIYIDGEPVLYRAVSDIYKDKAPISINRVGIAVNWEWGDDTGSRFSHFVARGRSDTHDDH